MIRILVVEDNDVLREMMHAVLCAADYEVDDACNGEEALQKLEQSVPDLLLLDLRMPIMDGYTLIREIRKNPRLAHLPAVAVTAYAMKEDRERVAQAGFDAYVTKPIDVAQFRTFVAGLLRAAPRAAR